MLSFDSKTGNFEEFTKQFKLLSQAQQTTILTSNTLNDAQKDYLAKSVGVTLATNGQAVSTENLSKSQVVATGTTTGLSTAFKGLWATMKPVLVALATNPLTWIVAAGAAAVILEDLFTVDYSEANKALDDSIQRYDETKEKLESLNKEYDTNEEKIKELNNLKGSNSITEEQQKELDNLELQNKSLETQIKLEQELLELQNQAKIDNARVASEKESHSVAQSIETGDSSGKSTARGSVGKVTDADAIKEDLKLIDRYENETLPKLQEDLIKAKQDVEKYEALGVNHIFKKMGAEASVKYIEEEIQHYKDSLITLYDDLESRSSNIQNQLDILRLDPTKNKEQIEILERALNSLTEEILEVEEAIESVNATTIAPSFSDVISGVESLSNGLDQLANVYKDVKDGKDFDYSSILNNEDFKTTFGGYTEEYEKFIETVTNSPKDIKACQSAFDDLATAYINGSGKLDNLTEETKEATIAMLKQMGVANAEEVVTKALTQKQALLAAEKFYNANATKNLVDMTEQEYNALLSEAKACGITEEWLAKVELAKIAVNTEHLDTTDDIDSVIALANAAGQSIQYLLALKQAIADYNDSDVVLNAEGGALKFKQKQEQKISSLQAKVQNQLKNSAKLNASDFYADVDFNGGSIANSSSGSSAKETEESFDWIERAVKKVQRTITNLGKTVSATYKSWTTRNSALTQQISAINSEISLQQKAYDYYMKKASEVGLSSSYIKKIQDGTINIETIKDESLINKINEYQELYDKALTAKDAIIDLNDEIASLAKSRFDNVVTQFEEQISLIEHESSVLDALISQAEASGHVVSTSFYESLIDVENKNLAALKNEYATLQNALNQAMAEGKIEKYSSDWYDMMNQINGVELAIIESNTALIEYQKNIRDLEWEAFDRMQEQISQITNESEFLIDLLSNEDLFNDDGGITKHGQATFGLHAVNYNTNLEQAKKYYEELSEIRKDLAKDKYDVDLLAREEELREAFQDTALAAKQEEQALIDLAEEGYNKMLDYMSELIDKQKELLNSQKDLFDYSNTISEQTEEIARLEKIAQAVANDDSEEGRLRAQQNATALEEARKELEQTEYEKYIQDQEQLYDQIIDETEQWIDERLSNTDQLLADIINATNENAASILNTLETEVNEVGGALTTEMSNIWANGGNAANVVSTYSEGISDNITNVVTVLERIEDFVSLMAESSDKEAVAKIKNTTASTSGNTSGTTSSSSSSTSTSSGTSTSSSASSTSSSSKWGSWFISKKNSVPDSQLKIDSSIVDRLKYLDYDSSFSARAKYYAAMGLGSASSYTGSASQNKAMIDLMKKNGFHSGGYIGSLIKSSGEDGIAFVKKGEYILTSDQFEKLRQTMDYAQPFINAFDKMPRFDSTGLNNTITNNIDMNINMYEVSDVDGLVTELQHNKRFERIIDAMGSGRMLGKNSYNKYKY